MTTITAPHKQHSLAFTPTFSEDALLPDACARAGYRTVEHLVHLARVKANGANVHTVNHTIAELRCWCYVRPRSKTRTARQAATANAIACALKLRAFIVTGRITL